MNKVFIIKHYAEESDFIVSAHATVESAKKRIKELGDALVANQKYKDMNPTTDCGMYYSNKYGYHLAIQEFEVQQ